MDDPAATCAGLFRRGVEQAAGCGLAVGCLLRELGGESTASTCVHCVGVAFTGDAAREIDQLVYDCGGTGVERCLSGAPLVSAGHLGQCAAAFGHAVFHGQHVHDVLLCNDGVYAGICIVAERADVGFV